MVSEQAKYDDVSAEQGAAAAAFRHQIPAGENEAEIGGGFFLGRTQQSRLADVGAVVRVARVRPTPDRPRTHVGAVGGHRHSSRHPRQDRRRMVRFTEAKVAAGGEKSLGKRYYYYFHGRIFHVTIYTSCTTTTATSAATCVATTATAEEGGEEKRSQRTTGMAG